MTVKHCCNCMNELSGEVKICPKCGFDNSRYVQPDEALPCGTVLNNRYLIGRMIGQGGFGLTYIGYDNTLGMTPVCIKEYFPAGGAMRGQDGSTRVYWSSGSTGAALKEGRETFVEEAKKAARVRILDSVVSVWDVFNENDTAYIVMEYIKGVTLKDYLKKRGTVMDSEECLGLLLPVIRDLQKVHEKGIVHRDISPDNLMVREDGKILLLDLGAAKDLLKGSEQSTLLITKKGFSPPEQHIEGMPIGSWTDVYAMCATIYWCMTGKMLPDVLYRVSDETLEFPKGMPEAMKEVLEHGLRTIAAERIQDMKELEKELEAALEVIRDPERLHVVKDPTGNRKWPAVDPDQKYSNPGQPEENLKQPAEDKEQPKDNPNQPEWKIIQPSEEPGQPTGGRKKSSKPSAKVILAIVAVAILAIAAFRIMHGSGDRDTTVEETAGKENTGTKDEQPGTAAADMTAEQEEPGADGQKAAELSTLSKDKFTEWADRTVETVVFQNTLDGVPSDAEDLSEKGDRSVLGWKDGEKLCIAGEGGVRAPEDCSYLFSDDSDDLEKCWSKLASVKNAEFFDVSNVIVTDYMFNNCKNLNELNVSNWNTSKVTKMIGMFYGCSSLASLDVSKWDTSNVEYLPVMFYECMSLSSLDLHGWNTSKVKDVEGMFIACSGLKELDISGWKTSNVNSMRGIFQGCSSLTTLEVGNWDTSNVGDMSNMFHGCSSLASLDVSKWNTSRVTEMRCMFSGCSNLTDLDVSGWDTSNLVDKESMFKGTKWEDDPLI